mmetsp:Transcript_91978/g.134429  ORF Transcript_91978/g.134429 Transcript_91978/m.134429 type:complete len:92 (-) Transcript_91978:1408-1683(-)
MNTLECGVVSHAMALHIQTLVRAAGKHTDETPNFLQKTCEKVNRQTQRELPRKSDSLSLVHLVRFNPAVHTHGSCSSSICQCTCTAHQCAR